LTLFSGCFGKRLAWAPWLSHFVNYAKEDMLYALSRYGNEYDRLLAVMDVRLRDREFLGGEYSIADMASFPWVLPYKRLGNDLEKFANVRPAVRKGIDLGNDWPCKEKRDETARSLMF
jgi:GST-like protein